VAFKFGPKRRLIGTGSVPAIFHVNRHARQFARRPGGLYERAFSSGSDSGIWINFELDTLYVGWEHFPGYSTRRWDSRLGADINRVKTLAICDRSHTGDYDPRVVGDLSESLYVATVLSQFGRNVEKLILATPDHPANVVKRDLAFTEFAQIEICLNEYRRVYEPVRHHTFRQFELSFRAAAERQHSNDMTQLEREWRRYKQRLGLDWELPSSVERLILTDIATKELFEKRKRVYETVRNIYEESGIFRETGFVMRGNILG